MSYLERLPGQLTWMQPIQSLIRRETGCVQCGAQLEANEFGKLNLSGKCLSCTGWVSDEDEIFEDLEG